MLHDCKEKRKKKIELEEFSVIATEQFVKFLYGFELEHEDFQKDLELVKELLIMGGLYDVEDLQRAASKFIYDHFTKKNVFDVMEFAKTNKTDTVMELGCEYVLGNWPIEEIVSQREKLLKFPELGMAVINRKMQGICNFHVQESPLESRISKWTIFKYEVGEPFVHRLKVQLKNCMAIKKKIMTEPLKGFGLLLMPGSDLDIKVLAKVRGEMHQVYKTKNNIISKKGSLITPIYFDTNVQVSNTVENKKKRFDNTMEYSETLEWDFEIEIKGNGTGLGTWNWSNGLNGHGQNPTGYEDYKNYESQTVTVQWNKNPVAEIYFSK